MRRASKIAAVAVVASMALTGCGKNNTDTSGSKSTSQTDICKTAKGTRPQGRSRLRRRRPGRPVLQRLGRTPVSRRPSRTSTPRASRARPRTASPSRPARTGCARWPTPATTRSSASASPTATPSTRSPRTTRRPASRSSTVRPRQEAQPNVAYLDVRRQRGLLPRRRGGGAHTKTNQIGFVGGVHNDLIKTFEAGYTAGAKAVNPKHQGRRRVHPGEQPSRLQRPRRRQDRRCRRVRQGRRRGLPRRRRLGQRRLRRRGRGRQRQVGDRRGLRPVPHRHQGAAAAHPDLGAQAGRRRVVRHRSTRSTTASRSRATRPTT